ncbi:MAG: hypothetical protein ACTHMM_22155 [Agriterribacter sp.]
MPTNPVSTGDIDVTPIVLSASDTLYPNDRNGTLARIDNLPPGTSVDDIFFFDINGEYFRRVIDGPMSAGYCGIYPDGTDQTSNFSAAFSAGVKTIVFDKADGGEYLINSSLNVPTNTVFKFCQGNYMAGTGSIIGKGYFDADCNQAIFLGDLIIDGMLPLSDVVSPANFGAVGDDIVDDTVPFQRMFDYIATLSRDAVNISIPSRSYYCQYSVYLPKTSLSPVFEISGYGASIRTNNNEPIWSRHPVSSSEATTSIDAYRCVIKGIRFMGNSTSVEGQSNQIGLDIGATYTWVIEDCNFYRLYIGVKALFWLNGKIANCMFTQNIYCDIIGRYGDWTGADRSNSAFNSNQITGCRFFSYVTSFTTVFLLAADQTVIRDCIAEGNNPQFNFYMDYDGSTTVLSNIYENIWIESIGGTYAQNTNFQLTMSGTVILRNIRRTYPNRLFEISSNSVGHLIVDGLPYASNLPTSGLTFFSRNGSDYAGRVISFTNINTASTSIMEQPGNWDGGVVARFMYINLFVTNGAGYPLQVFKNSTSTLISANSILLSKQSWFTNSPFRGVYINPPAGDVAAPPFGQRLLVCTDETASSIPAVLASANRHIVQYGGNNSSNGGNQFSCIYVSTENDNGRAPIYSTVRARGILSQLTSVINGTILRIDRSEAFDGVGLVAGAMIRHLVDGTPSTGIVPTSWEIQLMNGAGVLQTALKIRASGKIELPVVPDSGNTTDAILTRSTGGELRQLPMSTIIASGNFTGNGDGSTTNFTVMHGTGKASYQVCITPTSPVAAENFYVANKTSTSFDLAFLVPPATGIGNVTFDWFLK